MGMRQYLNGLRLSLVRVKNAKQAKEEAKKRADETETTSTLNEVTAA